MIAELLVGLLLGIALGGLGYRSGLLTVSGAVSILVISVITFGLADWVWGAVLVAYVLSAGLLARYGANVKAKMSDRFLAYRRGWRQVWAPLGWSTVMVLFNRLTPHSVSIFVAFVGAVATVSADTWATELGVLNIRPPRLITSRQRVVPGTPGAISVLGVVAALAAAWLIGFLGLSLTVLAAWLQNLDWQRILLWLPLAATVGGIAGCLVDSLLSATAQGVYYCEHCQQQTERRIHSCGHVAQQIRGWAWLTNDGVNLVSSVVGAAVAAGLVAWLAQTII
jgi:uncharacterized protein (TIGR00297 family)